MKKSVTNVTQRVPNDLLDKIRAAADEDGMSINAFINKACRQYVNSNDRPMLERRVRQLEAKIAEFDETKEILQKMGKIVNALTTT